MPHNDVAHHATPMHPMHRRFWITVLAAIAGLLILPTGRALAVPVAPGEIQLVQPDGTVIAAIPFGDEWASGYEHQGYTILLDRASGYWVYAQENGIGRLASAAARVGIDKPPTGLPRHLRESQAAPAPEVAGSSSLAPEAVAGASGPQKVLIIVVDFTPSTSRGTSEADWNGLFFDDTAGVKSIRNYYEEASFGAFSLDPAAETWGTANDGVIAVTLGYAHPNPDETGDVNRLIVRNALIAADASIDYSSLDLDGNGGLDTNELHLMIIVRGFEKAYGGADGACTPSVWGHRWSLGDTVAAPELDGVYVAAAAYGGGYTQEGEWHQFKVDGCTNPSSGHMATIGIMAHELGHDIDWPDLYDTDLSSEGVGNWSIMGAGSWGRASGSEFSGNTPVLPDAFLKWYQGWITPEQVTGPQTGVALPNSAENPVAYLLGANPGEVDWNFENASGTGEYFLIENRQLEGFDAGLWSIDGAGAAKGCLIWHVDETRRFDNLANANETRKLLDLEEADGPPQDLDATGNRGDVGDPWPGTTGETVFGAASNPNSAWYSGLGSGVEISAISTDGTGCTVDFSGIGVVWDGSEGSDWGAADNWTVGRVPNSIDHAVIPGGVSNWPNVSSAASVGDLAILDGAQMTADADVALDVYGDWTEEGNGTFAAGVGTVAFRGSGAQSIISGAGSHFHHLQIGDGSATPTVTAASDLDVNGDLTIQAGARLALGDHTLTVGGDWTDVPFGFAPEGGAVVLDGTTQTIQREGSEFVVYSNDLSSLTGWGAYDGNNDKATWYGSSSTTAPNSPDSGQHARYSTNHASAANDWLLSPSFALQAGATYTIHFAYGASVASKPEKLAVYVIEAWGADPSLTQVFNNGSVVNTTWREGTGTFTPSSTGTYYVGFLCYSDANQGDLAVDDLVVTTPDPDLAFYDLSVADGSTATLGDDAAVQHDLTVATGGSLSLGAYDVTVEGAVTNSGAMAQTLTVDAASTTFLALRNGAGSTDKYLGATIDPGAGTMGSTTVTVWGNQYCPSATQGVLRCFEIDPTTSAAAAITFYYTEAERNGETRPSMLVYHWDGGTWNQETGTTTRGGSGDGQWVKVTDVDAYSPFSLATGLPTAVMVAGFGGSGLESGRMMPAWAGAASGICLAAVYIAARRRAAKTRCASRRPRSY